MLKASVGIFIFFICLNNTILCQSNLNISEIMKGHTFVGYLLKSVYWSEDGKSIYFTWNPDNDLLESQYKVDLKGLIPYKVGVEELRTLPEENGVAARSWIFICLKVIS